MRTRNGVVLCLLLVAALAGCGRAGSGGGVATAGGTAHPSGSAPAAHLSEQEKALAFAKCMRENGVPQFPDPRFDGNGGVSINLPPGTDRAKVAAAERKCQQYAAGGGPHATPDPQRLEQARQYAKCMRDNGVPDFPDPGSDGGIAVDGNKIDLNGGTARKANEKCQHLMGAGGGGQQGTTTNGSNG